MRPLCVFGRLGRGKKEARETMESPPRIYCFFIIIIIIIIIFFFLLGYPAEGSMEERATVTLKLSDFTIK